MTDLVPDGWSLLFEWPYCKTCGVFTWEHTHRETGEPRKSSIPPAMFTHLYVAIGAEPPCSPEEAKRAYRATMQRVHPDHGGDPAEARRAIAAYDDLRARGLAA